MPYGNGGSGSGRPHKPQEPCAIDASWNSVPSSWPLGCRIARQHGCSFLSQVRTNVSEDAIILTYMDIVPIYSEYSSWFYQFTSIFLKDSKPLIFTESFSAPFQRVTAWGLPGERGWLEARRRRLHHHLGADALHAHLAVADVRQRCLVAPLAPLALVVGWGWQQVRGW